MVTLTFYGGITQVGGNKTLLEDGSTRLFLDFGTPFAEWGKYYEEYMKPRPGAGLLDPLEMGLLPPLRGLYRTDLEDPTGSLWHRFESNPLFRDFRGVKIQGVLLSHAHLDHSGYISFLAQDIPVYSTAMTALIAKAVQDTQGGSDFEREVSYFSPRKLQNEYLRSEGVRVQRPFYFVDVKDLSPQVRRFWDGRFVKPRNKPIEWMEMDSLAEVGFVPERAGNLKFRHWPVDHSVPGACAYAVETSCGWVVYTGDLRLHGKRGEKTEAFIRDTHSLKTCILLCEGTRTGDSAETAEETTEEEVFENCLAAAKKSGGLVIADFAPRNIERLTTFLRIAKDTGRRLVVLAKDAYLLWSLKLLQAETLSLENDAEIYIYKEFKDSLDAWEQHIHQSYEDRLVGHDEIRRRPREYLLCFSFFNMKNMIDVRPQGGTYIYSSSKAYDDEQSADLQRLREWVNHFGMELRGDPDSEKGFHASGHARAPELLDIVKGISPRILIPIHTEKPEYFRENLKGLDIEVLTPKEGERLSF
ncbi:MAG: exonuclease [Chloroflexi bacterium]|nr:exonuclease [Chloroflexota bacterium]